ncbi:MAG TPA: hypothetical protein VF183_10875 [Acidimicrobiales bacterium]
MSERVSISINVSPEPTPEEAAAIMAAYEVLWPKPVVSRPQPTPSRWRFSGRWWASPLPLRRARP